MGLYRMYTEDDAQTHIELLDLTSYPELVNPTAVSSIVFQERESCSFMDWHPAPRLQ